MTKKLLWALCLTTQCCLAQNNPVTTGNTTSPDTTAPRFFTLGEVEVISKRQSDINGFLSAQKLQTFAKTMYPKHSTCCPAYTSPPLAPL